MRFQTEVTFTPYLDRMIPAGSDAERWYKEQFVRCYFPGRTVTTSTTQPIEPDEIDVRIIRPAKP